MMLWNLQQTVTTFTTSSLLTLSKAVLRIREVRVLGKGAGWCICCHCSPFSTSVSIRVSFRENSRVTSLNKNKQKGMSQRAEFLFFYCLCYFFVARRGRGNSQKDGFGD